MQKSLPQPSIIINSFQSRSLFRRLWRAGNASVLYSRPAVKYVHKRIREGFEEYRNETNEKILKELYERVENTIKFMEIASRRGGFEHRVIYTLCQMTYIEDKYRRRPPYANKRLKPEVYLFYRNAYDEYYRTLKLMNDSLRTCLR
ncbi:hypothetical protein Glove_140g135 [Diversispora epigaea]|uniref:Complex 1 LYR protein domain-containing protein n=1 Tax=Diversispora epigaea TaxID=1348612 RepID=A0A397J4R0_9GLOM|nr:hypothetical protein Glove_140g135 [Diversispora epigaea]